MLFGDLLNHEALLRIAHFTPRRGHPIAPATTENAWLTMMNNGTVNNVFTALGRLKVSLITALVQLTMGVAFLQALGPEP